MSLRRLRATNASRHLAALVLVLARFVRSTAPADAAETPVTADSVWAAPAAARSVAWPEVATEPVELNPDESIEVSPGRVTLVPVNAGDQVRLDGGEVTVGFASGTNDTYPDVVTWIGAMGPGVMRVPTWSSARFLALRADAARRVELEIAARTADPMHQHRLDEAVHAWLGGGTDAVPTAKSAEEQRVLEAVQGLRVLLDRSFVGAPRRAAVGRLPTRLLHTYWLERRLSLRQLEEPFFVREELRVEGGEVAAEAVALARTDDKDWRVLDAGRELSALPGDAEVLSFAVRARALGQTRVQIWSGKVLLRDLLFQIPRRAEGSTRWTPARVERIAPRGRHALRVVVIEGAVRVSIEGRRAEHGILGQAPAHRRRALAASLPASGAVPAWLAELLTYQLDGGDAAFDALERHLAAAASGSEHGPQVPPAALALIAYDILPALVGRPFFAASLAQFWSATEALPRAARDALRASLLERLRATLAEPISLPPSVQKLAAPEQSESENSPLVAALLASVIASGDGARPRELFELERRAAEQVGDGQLVDLAHEAWTRAAPWQALVAPGATERTITRRPFDANQPSGMCENQGARGLRWWIVPSAPTEFEVADLGGTHSSVRLLPLAADAREGSEVLIGDQPVRVQPTLGEESRVGLRPGVHRIQQRAGGAVIARIPRVGSTPCDQLVEMERWAALRGELLFQLPPGDAPTIASVIVDPSSIPPAGARLDVSIGPRGVSAWVRLPASGDIELMVPPGATELRVRSNQLLLVRARARMHPDPAPELARTPAADPVSTEDGLTQLSELTTHLRRAVGSGERKTLRTRRSELLLRLGYPELAELDGARAGQPDVVRRLSLPGALFLPERPEPVVPLGIAARAPLLPIASPLVVERALAFDRLGQSKLALSALVAERAQEGVDAGALLAARLASDLGDAELAGSIFERLGRATGSAALLEAAAERYDQLALATGGLDHTGHAFILAKLAGRAGASMNAFLSRYASAVEWTAPSLSSLGVKARNVDAPPAARASDPVGSRVRRALTLAPLEARQFRSEASFNVRRWRARELVVESLCFNREGPVEGCHAELLVDGAPVRCAKGDSTEPSVALPESCALTLSETATELMVRLPAGERRMGWALLAERTIDAAGVESSAPVVWQQTHASMSSETPIRLDLVGPSVFRVSARALGTQGASLEVYDVPTPPLASPASDQAVPIVTLSVAASAPAGATDVDAEAVSEPQAFEYVVERPGPHQITLLATTGRWLVRPEMATIVAPPEPLIEDVVPVAPAPREKDPARFELGLSGVRPRPSRPLLSLAAELSAQDRDVAESDSDRRDRYAQAAVVVRRAFFSDRAWVEASSFARFREGASSLGVDVASGSAVSDLVPGAFASLRLVAQPAFDALGASANAGVRHRVPLGRSSSLWPELSATWRRAEPAASVEPDVDADVYSAYAMRRPWSVDAKTAVSQRPFTDSFARHALGLRVIPDGFSIDRIDARSDYDVLAGSGWMPWLGLGLSISHRPSSELREHPFTRFQVASRATFWQWLGDGSRLRSDLEVSFFIDAPNPSGAATGLFASIVLGYDFLLGSGLGDFRPSTRLFRDRLEEDGPAPPPIQPATDIYWQGEESP